MPWWAYFGAFELPYDLNAGLERDLVIVNEYLGDVISSASNGQLLRRHKMVFLVNGRIESIPRRVSSQVAFCTIDE